MTKAFKVGDKVKIAHKVEEAEGWGDVWIGNMDETVGRIGFIYGIEVGGYNVVFSDGPGGWNYPAEALELVGGWLVNLILIKKLCKRIYPVRSDS